MKRVIPAGYIIACTLICLNLFVWHWFIQSPRSDFTSIWAGARALDPYNIREVADLQAWMWGAKAPLAFVYPPSSLPFYFPFAASAGPPASAG